MRRSWRRPALVGGKRCRQSQYFQQAGSTSRSRPAPCETRYRRERCGRARTSLSVRAKNPFTPPQFLLAWVLEGSHGTPTKRKTRCSATGLRRSWHIRGVAGNPRCCPGNGEGGIRTHGRFPFKRFRVVRFRPLSHLSSGLSLGVSPGCPGNRAGPWPANRPPAWGSGVRGRH